MKNVQDAQRFAAIIDQMSIWSRLAFGITCLERLCAAWSASGGEGIRNLLDCFWSFGYFVKRRSLDQWEEKCDVLLPEDLRQIPTLTGNPKLSDQQQMVLYHVIDDVWEIGRSNLYTEFRTEFTRQPTLSVIGYLQNNAIELPDLQLFLKSTVSENGGWGNPSPPEYFQG